MSKPVWEYRIVRHRTILDVAGGDTVIEADAVSLGSEERAARARWEKERAEFMTARASGSIRPNRGEVYVNDAVRMTFEARKVVPWNVLDDTTPDYERGEEESDAATT